MITASSHDKIDLWHINDSISHTLNLGALYSKKYSGKKHSRTLDLQAYLETAEKKWPLCN